MEDYDDGSMDIEQANESEKIFLSSHHVETVFSDMAKLRLPDSRLVVVLDCANIGYHNSYDMM